VIFLLTLIAADVNFIAVDVHTRQVVERQWADAEQPVPVGSLVKPFVALAYGGEFPEYVCKGAADECWLAKGHGKLGFHRALAQSCNAYFLNLARGVDGATLAVIAAKFGIPPPLDNSAEARIGLGKDWQIAPLALVRAYAELASRAGEPRVDEILAGLRMAAESGTAKALGRGVLAKTGTAACVAERRDAGDGFAVVLEPAEDPRVALLVRVHGAPGATAAKSAARILRRMRSGE
jgi:cell division protein FtsI/penicillin-binding protein 2